MSDDLSPRLRRVLTFWPLLFMGLELTASVPASTSPSAALSAGPVTSSAPLLSCSQASPPR